jgi:transposase
LYQAVLSGHRFNPVLATQYQALTGRGKEKKVALVACMHKLLRILAALARHGTSWDPTPDA